MIRETYAAERVERTFRHGQFVLFSPPEAAYSRHCAQSVVAGQIGEVYRQWNDGLVDVRFHGFPRPIVCNAAYLQDVRP